MKVCSRGDFEAIGAGEIYDNKYANNDIQGYLFCMQDNSFITLQNFDMEKPAKQFNF